jgi:hypothetical protein
MSDIKTKFTLHTEYQDFMPGVSHLDFKTLSPGCMTMGCLLPMTLVSVGISFFLAYMIYGFSVVPLFIHVFGQDVTGSMIDCRMSENKDGSMKVSSYTYTYSWDNQEFKRVHANFNGEDGDCNQDLNQPISIRVLPFNPVASRPSADISGLSTMSLSVWGVGVIMILGTFGLCLIHVRYVQARIIYPRLTQNGILLEGEITRISGDTPSKSNQYFVSVKYQFQSPTGRILKGRAHAHRQDLRGKDLPPVGTPVTILYADDSAHMML